MSWAAAALRRALLPAPLSPWTRSLAKVALGSLRCQGCRARTTSQNRKSPFPPSSDSEELGWCSTSLSMSPNSFCSFLGLPLLPWHLPRLSLSWVKQGQQHCSSSPGLPLTQGAREGLRRAARVLCPTWNPLSGAGASSPCSGCSEAGTGFAQVTS